MKKVIAVAALLAVCWLGSGCREPAPAPPAAQHEPEPAVPTAPPAPEAPAIANPPPLGPDAADTCVVRSFDPSSGWTTVAHDAQQARLELIGEKGSERYETFAYDAHGNLREHLKLSGDELIEGRSWDNRYEGKPPRLVAQAIGKLDKVGGKSAVHTRIGFSYDDAGRLIEQRIEEPRGTSVRKLGWREDRITEILTVREPAPPNAHVPYQAALRLSRDASGRLTAYELDGEAFGEGGAADGKPDQRMVLRYDAEGRLERVERDGMLGDVAPQAPDGTVDGVTLITPACAGALVRLPQLFALPDWFLPNSLKPSAP